jgi:hypothetical protein
MIRCLKSARSRTFPLYTTSLIIPMQKSLVVPFLDETFPGRWVGRRGPTAWPPRFPDLTPLDIFAGGFIKDVVYSRKFRDLADLRRGIIEAVELITPHMLINTWQKLENRLDICLVTTGCPHWSVLRCIKNFLSYSIQCWKNKFCKSFRHKNISIYVCIPLAWTLCIWTYVWQCRKFSCGTVVCKHFASYQDYLNYRWDLRNSVG